MDITSNDKEYSQIEEFLDGFGDDEESDEEFNDIQTSLFNGGCLLAFEEICMTELLDCLNGFSGQHIGI